MVVSTCRTKLSDRSIGVGPHERVEGRTLHRVSGVFLKLELLAAVFVTRPSHHIVAARCSRLKVEG